MTREQAREYATRIRLGEPVQYFLTSSGYHICLGAQADIEIAVAGRAGQKPGWHLARANDPGGVGPVLDDFSVLQDAAAKIAIRLLDEYVESGATFLYRP